MTPSFTFKALFALENRKLFCSSACLPLELNYVYSIAPRFVYNGTATKRPATLEKESFYRFFDQLVEDFGENMPDAWATHPDSRWLPVTDQTKETRPLIFLHCGLFSTKKAVFKDFHDRRIVSKTIPPSTMRTWWIADWWNVKVKKWQPFAKCDKCTKFRTELLVEPNEARLQEIRQERGKHRQNISLGRRRCALREMMSIEHPDDFLSATIDGMDNKKTNVPQPRGITYAKGPSQVGEPLKTRLMGAC